MSYLIYSTHMHHFGRGLGDRQANKITAAKLIIISPMADSIVELILRIMIIKGQTVGPFLKNLLQETEYQIRLDDCDLLMDELDPEIKKILKKHTRSQEVKYYTSRGVDLIITSEPIPPPIGKEWIEHRIGDRYLYSPNLMLGTRELHSAPLSAGRNKTKDDGEYHFYVSRNLEEFRAFDRLSLSEQEKIRDRKNKIEKPIDHEETAEPIGCGGPRAPICCQGATDAIGCQGPQGPRGAQGPQGPRGAQSPQGLMGATGPIGCIGPTGPMGCIGPTGPMGIPVPYFLACEEDAPTAEIAWTDRYGKQKTSVVVLPRFLVRVFAILYPLKKAARSRAC